MPRLPLARLATAAAAVAIFILAACGIAVAADAGSPPDGGMSLAGIVTHTPAWVWAVLVALIWVGVRRMRDRETGLAGLVVFPLVLAALSLYGAIGGGASVGSAPGLGIGALLGIAAGVALERRAPALPLGGGRLRLRGDWTSLLVVLAVFATRYAKGVAVAVNPTLAASDAFVLAAAGTSGFFAAMLLARTLLRLQVALRPVAPINA